MPPGLIVLCIVALLLLFFLSLRASIRIVAKEEFQVFLQIACFKKQLFTKKKKQKGRKQSKKGSKPTSPSKKDSIDDLLRQIKLAGRILKILSSKFSKHLRLKLSKLIIVVGGSDAADAAIRYGAVSSAVAYLITLLESFVPLKTNRKSLLYVQPDFLNNRLDYEIDISLSASVVALLTLFLRSLKIWKDEKKKAALQGATEQ